MYNGKYLSMENKFVVDIYNIDIVIFNLTMLWRTGLQYYQ